MSPLTDDQIDAAVLAQRDEFALWASRKNLPPRNGMGIDDWMKAQQASTYVVMRAGVDMTGHLPDALSEPEFFILRDCAAMRAAIGSIYEDLS